MLVSPHRALRPWQGQVEEIPNEVLPTYDPSCYLCPGNSRVGGFQNPPYKGTFVFDNDFPALLLPGAEFSPDREIRQAETDLATRAQPDWLFRAEMVSGICRVVCFSERHDLTLPEMALNDVEAVLQTWSEQTAELGENDFIRYVQVFENKGAMMGCSNPHPHSQIWATSFIPNEPAREQAAMCAYLETHGTCVVCDLLHHERENKQRLVCENEHFSAFVPFWAVWPFEILVIAHRHVASLPDLNKAEIASLADLLHRVTVRFDNLFRISFPYSMGFHQSPFDGKAHKESHLHLHFYPPLLRSATVRKFMVGFEMLGMPQRDLTSETAAERLRGLSETHFKERRETG